jgi:phenylacetate-CoA ligase
VPCLDTKTGSSYSFNAERFEQNMSGNFWNEEIECIPLDKIPDLQERRLKQSNVIARAYSSALYRENWEAIGVNPELVKTRKALKTLPFLTNLDLRAAFAKSPMSEIMPIGNVRLWFSTSGSTGSPKWIPYGDDDLSLFEDILLRDYYVRRAYRASHRIMAIMGPPPFASDGLAYASIFAEIINDQQLETILVAPTETRAEILGLARARKVDSLFSFPSIAMRMAERIADSAEGEIKRRFQEQKNLSNFAALLITRFKNIKVKDMLKFKAAIFSGEALTPYRQAIIDNFNANPYEIYTFTEFPCLNIECPFHNGIHLWIDTCIAEIIPQDELDKEERDPGYTPKTIFIDEAKEGNLGEYVLTTFSHTLPLIRYRTSDLMEVISTQPCGCGRTHPRIRVRRRLDDVVNMGLFRFSTFQLEARLSEVSQTGRVRNWQLRLDREGYKPKPILLIDGDGYHSEPDFISEVRVKIFEIEILKSGCEAGIISQPEIKLVPKISEQLGDSGKLKRVVYSSNW